MHLLRILRLQYSTECICAAIGDISLLQSTIYCKPGAKCSAQPPAYAMWTVVPDTYNAFTDPHIQASIFNWTYLRCHWRYFENTISVIVQSWCLILHTSSSLRYVNRGPAHIQCNYSSAYSGFNIRLNVSAQLLEIIGHFDARYTANLELNTAHIVQFTLCWLWSRTYRM
jgi:hypothetical protein